MTRLRSRARRCRGLDDEGSAIIEFCFLAILLLIPLTYVILTVFRLQGAAYAVSSAAREAGRIYVTTERDGARERASAAADVAMRDHGYRLAPGGLTLACGNPQNCREPQSFVRVTIEHRVPLPLIPDFFSAVVPTSVSVSAEHLEYVDRFRAAS